MNLFFRNYESRLLLIATSKQMSIKQGLCQCAFRGEFYDFAGFSSGQALVATSKSSPGRRTCRIHAFAAALSPVRCKFALEIAIVDSMELFHRSDVDPLTFRMEVSHSGA
jgi:hypothetical protein